MKANGLNQCKIIAGKQGLMNKVNYATIMEVPDIVNWLKGKEIILTSLYAIKDDLEAQATLISRLNHAGASAIAIKPRRFIGEIPAIILEEADKYNFPVIEIPKQISYLDILAPVMNTIFNNKVVLQQDMEQTDQILNEISLGSKGMPDLIEMLQFLTKNLITVESQLPYIEVPEPDFTFKPLNEKQIKELSLVKRPIKLKREYENNKVDCITAPIFIDDGLSGNITSWGVNWEHAEVDLAILEKATTLLALEFLKLKVKFDVEQQYKNDYLRDLLLNDVMDLDEIKERGTKFNFSVDRSYACLIIQVLDIKENNNRVNKFKEIETLIQRKMDNVVTGHIKEWFCILYPIEEEDNQELKLLATEFYEFLISSLFPKVNLRIGVGQYYPGIKGLRRSFQEAVKAVQLSDINKHIISYRDLGVYSLLGQIDDPSELVLFYDETIGKLIKYDTTSELQLVKTLRCYFANDEKLKQTADNLYIHVNTLKYRMKRIEQITNYNLQKSNDKLMLHLGLKIKEMMSGDYLNG